MSFEVLTFSQKKTISLAVKSLKNHTEEMLPLEAGRPSPPRALIVIWVILRLAGVRWFWPWHFLSHLRSSVWTCRQTQWCSKHSDVVWLDLLKLLHVSFKHFEFAAPCGCISGDVETFWNILLQPQSLYFFRSLSFWVRYWVKLVWLNDSTSASHTDTSTVNISACDR